MIGMKGQLHYISSVSTAGEQTVNLVFLSLSFIDFPVLHLFLAC